MRNSSFCFESLCDLCVTCLSPSGHFGDLAVVIHNGSYNKCVGTMESCDCNRSVFKVSQTADCTLLLTNHNRSVSLTYFPHWPQGKRHRLIITLNHIIRIIENLLMWFTTGYSIPRGLLSELSTALKMIL